MSLLFSDPVFTSKLVQALSWTLIHSLWQGMLLAAVVGAVLHFTKRSRAAVRYNVLTILLLIFITGSAITCGITIGTSIQNASMTSPQQIQDVPATINATIVQVNKSPVSLVTKATTILNQYAGWIVLFWLVVMVVKCLRLGAGLVGLQQLKTTNTSPVGEYWNERMNVLSDQLGINRSVVFLQSAIIQVPAVVGYFKPMILFPIGMLAAVPAAEVEAVLLHELAHIRRRDFLVNLVQHITEIIFFFNPAVLWVSALIRTERENCCDDIAVGQTDNKRTYINALVSFQDFDHRQSHELSTAFHGNKGQLLQRIKRIIYNNNKTLNAMEKKLLAAGLILTSVFIFAFTTNVPIQFSKTTQPVSTEDNAAVNLVEDQPTEITDTIPDLADNNGMQGTFNTVRKGKKYVITLNNDQVTALSINGKNIPADKIGDYKKLTDEIINDAKKEMEQSKKEMEQSQIEMAQAQVEMEQSHLEMEESKKEMEQANIEMAQSMKEMEQAQLEMEQSKKEMEEDYANAKKDAEREMIGSKKELEAAKLEIALAQKEMAEAQKEMEKDMKQANIDIEKANEEMVKAKKQMELAKIDMAKAKVEMEEAKKLQEEFLGDLVSEKIIKSKEELTSYELSDESLIVNGVKQPDAIHAKFKKKYVKGKGWRMNMNR